MYVAQSLVANQSVPYAAHGSYFVMLAASDNLAKIRFYKNYALIDEIENLGAGVRYEGEFHSVEIVAGAAGADIEFYVSSNKVEYQRGAASVDVLSMPLTAFANTRFTVLATGVTQLRAANPGSNYLFIQNNGTDWLRFTVDGSAPSAVAGVRIAPGGYWDCPAHCAPLGVINAIAESGAGVAVEVMEG